MQTHVRKTNSANVDECRMCDAIFRCFIRDMLKRPMPERVFLGNLDFSVSQNAVWKGLQEAGVDAKVTFIQVSRKGSWKDHRSCAAFLTLTADASAEDVVKALHGQRLQALQGRPIRAEKAVPRIKDVMSLPTAPHGEDAAASASSAQPPKAARTHGKDAEIHERAEEIQNSEAQEIQKAIHVKAEEIHQKAEVIHAKPEEIQKTEKIQKAEEIHAKSEEIQKAEKIQKKDRAASKKILKKDGAASKKRKAPSSSSSSLSSTSAARPSQRKRKRKSTFSSSDRSTSSKKRVKKQAKSKKKSNR